MATPIPEGYHTLTPYLTFDNAAEAIDYYKDVFGAQERVRMEAPGGKIGHAELEIYGFNERAQRHAERAGFVREGVRRRAYWRHGEWVDGVLYGLVREDLD